MSSPRALLLIGICACACEARPVEGPSPAARDKQAMFGSASLVPTREGERARRELAVAGELEQALGRLELARVHVDVELRDPATVIVIAGLPTGSSVAETEAMVAKLAHAMVPELEPANLHLWLQAAVVDGPAPEQRPGPPSWALVLTCIGLGLSLGVLGERLRSGL